jgi:hypothetical protein
VPASPRRYLIVAARRLPAEVDSHRVPKFLPAGPFLVRRRYLVVVPKLLPAAPLAVRHTYLVVVLRPLLKSLLALTRRTRRCCIRRRTIGR